MQTQLRKFEIKLEPLGDKLTTVLPVLLNEHWEELATNKELMTLKPDLERYRILEEMGLFVALFAYANGKLIGYSGNVIVQNLHYSDLTMFQNDVLFISKEYRNSTIGLKLIKETERIAKEKGAKLMLWHAKENSPFAHILPKMGCKVQDIIYSKAL